MHKIYSTATFCSKVLNSQHVSAPANMTFSIRGTSNSIGQSQLTSNCVDIPCAFYKEPNPEALNCGQPCGEIAYMYTKNQKW